MAEEIKYNKDMTVGEVLESNPDAQVVFMGFGMHCCGCPASQSETLAEAAETHGVEVEDLIEELKAFDEDDKHCHCCDCGCEDGEECDCDDDEEGAQ